MTKKRLAFYLTNFVTLLRVVGIFALIPVYKIYGGVATFLLSAGCFLTDCVDGLMARSLKTSTFFGSLFDALSDKAFLVINMILLMTISPLAIVPILFELGIAYVQSVKYNLGMNIKSNKFGKFKMWIAGIVISLSYLLVDKTFINYLGANLVVKLDKYNEVQIFSTLFLPLVLSEMVTLTSYIKEYFNGKSKLTEEKIEKQKKEEEKVEEDMREITLSDLMFEHEYYEKYKDYGNLKLVRTLAKSKRR